MACSGVGFGVATLAGCAPAALLDNVGAFELCRAVAPSLGRAPFAPWPVPSTITLDGPFAADSLFGLAGVASVRAGRVSATTGSVTAELRASGELSLVWPDGLSGTPEPGPVKS